MENLNYEVNSFSRFLINIIITSVMIFILTGVVYFIMVILGGVLERKLNQETFLNKPPFVRKVLYYISNYINENNFLRGYHYSHLVLFYISGLITVIITIESSLIEEGLLAKALDAKWKFSTLILFLAVSNYTFFNSFVINNDFKYKKWFI